MNRRSAFATIEHLFGIDIRSLALVRIGTACLLLADLAFRLRELEAHYTDFGVLPRSALIETFGPAMGRPSLHLATGSAAGQAGLFLLAAVFALALLVGYRTWWATAISWLLLISLHNRNAIILQGGDTVLRMLLFWGMFLPLGACYSVDSALNPPRHPPDGNPPPTRILSWGSAALLLQVCLLYWFAAMLKNHPAWRSEGTAVFYALSISQFVTPLGIFVRRFPDLTKLLTFATAAMESFGPFFAFIPWRIGPVRTAVVCAFLGFHAALGACLTLGLFPWICAVAWMAFLPSWFWEQCRRRLRPAGADRVRLFFDGECGFCAKMAALIRTFLCLPEASVLPAQADPSILTEMEKRRSWVVVDPEGRRHFGFAAFAPLCRTVRPLRLICFLLDKPPLATWGDRLYRFVAARRDAVGRALGSLNCQQPRTQVPWIAEVTAAFFFGYVLLWNVRTTDFARYQAIFPHSVNWVADLTRVDQIWDMFAPYPLRGGGWYVIPGKLRNGAEVDLFRDGAPVRWDRPPLVSATLSSDRWRKYMVVLLNPDSTRLLYLYGNYLCRKWNRDHSEAQRLESLRIFYMQETAMPDFRITPPEKRLIWQQSCSQTP